MGIDRIGPVGPFQNSGGNQQRIREAGRLTTPPEVTREDSIELSSAARELAGAPSEARAELVRRLQGQVNDGSYRVDASQVAREMVERGDL